MISETIEIIKQSIQTLIQVYSIICMKKINSVLLNATVLNSYYINH